MAKQKLLTTCVYCGELKRTSSEHFVARSLLDEKPQQMWTITVCADCNREKSKDDDYLRDMLVADDACQWHPVARAVMRKVLRSASYGSSRVAISTRNATRSSMFSPGGVYMGDLLAVTLDEARLRRIFSWVTRGAYFYFFKQRIPDESTFGFRRLDRTRARELWALYAAQGKPIAVQGAGVFGCTAMTLDIDPFTSMWLLGFYQWLATANLAAQAFLNGIPALLRSRHHLSRFKRGQRGAPPFDTAGVLGGRALPAHGRPASDAPG